MGQGSRLIRPRTVTGDGDGLVSHAGIAWLAETADLSGLTAGLSAAMAGVPQRRHDPGARSRRWCWRSPTARRVCQDLAALRAQPACSVPVASEATVWRTFDQVGPVELRGIATAGPPHVQRAWAAGAGPAGDEVIIDVDATIDPHQGRQARRRADLQAHLRASSVVGDVRRDRRGPRRHPAPGQRRRRTPRSITSSCSPTPSTSCPPVWRPGTTRRRPVPVERRILVRADSAGLRTGSPRNASTATSSSPSATRSTNVSATASSWSRPVAGTPPSTPTAAAVTAPMSSSSPTSSTSTPGRTGHG